MPDPQDQDQKPKALEQPSLTSLPKQNQPSFEKPAEPTSTQKPELPHEQPVITEGFSPPPSQQQPEDQKQEDQKPTSPPAPAPLQEPGKSDLGSKPMLAGDQPEEKAPEPTPSITEASKPGPSAVEEPSITPPVEAKEEKLPSPPPPVSPPATTPPPSVKPLTEKPPPPPSTTSFPTEDPSLTSPKRGGGIKKILIFLALILAVVAGGFLIIRVLLPRIQSLRIPGIGGKKAVITYWGLWEPSSVIQEIIAEYNEEHPDIKVEYTQQSHKDYRERLQSAIARGEGPDIFRFHNTWVPMLSDTLDSLPSQVMSSSTFQETFYPVAASDLRVGANFVGIPLEIDGLAMFYNKRIFEAAGKNPPKTWEDLRKTAFELTIKDEKGNIQTAGVALGVTNNVDHWSDILGLMMLQNGANLANPTDKPATDALRFYTIFARFDKVWDKTLPGSTQAFASEKVAIYFAPSWRIIDLKALNPDLDFGVMPVPQLPNSTLTWASYWAEGVSNKSDYKQQAWEFLNYLSSKETLEKFYAAAVASGRPIGEPYSRLDMAPLLENDSLVGAYIQQAPNAQSWYLASFTHDNGINDRIITYFEDAINSLDERVEPEAALETAAQGITQVLSQYRVQ